MPRGVPMLASIVPRTRTCHRIFRSVPKWHYLTFYGIFTEKQILKKMHFFSKRALKMPTWEPWMTLIDCAAVQVNAKLNGVLSVLFRDF